VFEQRPFRVLNIKYDTGFDLKIKEKNLELIKEFDTTIPEVVMGDVTFTPNYFKSFAML
jgi:hypothetical protein